MTPCGLCVFRLGRRIAAEGPTLEAAGAWRQTEANASPPLAAAAARQLHCSVPAAFAKQSDGVPSLGGMPASDLSKTGSGGPHEQGSSATEETTTFRQNVTKELAGDYGTAAAASDESAEADHPAHKYEEKYNQGVDRADDTGVAGMPAGRKVATPKEGLGNTPGRNEPEPSGGRQGGLDSVPDELGANPRPHGDDGTRKRWGDEEKEPLIGKTGSPYVDARGEPGTAADGNSHGSTETVPEAPGGRK